jgi:tetratricopeptide (TPR) repeat protein
MKLIEVLLKEDNRSVMLEEVAKLRQSDPKSLAMLELDIQNALSNERLDEAIGILKERESLYGEDFNTLAYKITFLIKEKKFNEMIALAEASFKKYPDSQHLVKIMYSIRKEVYRDPKGALKLYEDYLTTNFNGDINKEYVKLLQDDGQPEKSLERRKLITSQFSYDPEFFAELANYHFRAKEYQLAEENVTNALQRSPYNEHYWELLGDVESDQKKTSEAIDAYNKSLLFDPNQYNVINKLRKLKGKSETYQLVPSINVDEIINHDSPAEAITSDRGYYIIREDKCAILHPGGALEEYNTYIVRITNEIGIDEFKESRIDYGRGQTLLIEQSEVVKKSGTKIKGERNENVIVFPNLEAGDVIVFRYRFQSYKSGRFRRDYWHKQFFADDAFIAHTRFTLLAPPTQKINYTFTNSDLKPVIKDVEDFKQYTWELVKQNPMKIEPLMPSWVDVAPVLHLSTVQKWNDIATWYADMINNASEESYELKSVFNALFPQSESEPLTQFAKAHRIYNFIQKNIRYSSVSFRQGAYLPQRASITLTTRLGDCKDLSNLFMTLCQMAKIEAKMVLVDTRDNGSRDMILPSLDFNHCIAKATLDGKEYYIELTDNYLPFTSLPNNLVNALILEIPKKSDVNNAELKPLTTQTKQRDIAKAHIVLKPEGSDLIVNVTSTKYGALSSRIRSEYSNLDYGKQFEKLEQTCASNYKNIVMDTVLFSDLENLNDSLSMRYQFRVKDEVAEIGSLRTFKLPFIDIVASLSRLPANARTYPVDYNDYEDTDFYETVIIVEAPKGKKLVELPSNEKFSFGGMEYSLSYRIDSSNRLEVVRKFSSNRNEIPVKEYMNFRTFVEKIVKAEQRMIAFQ